LITSRAVPSGPSRAWIVEADLDRPILLDEAPEGQGMLLQQLPARAAQGLHAGPALSHRVGFQVAQQGRQLLQGKRRAPQPILEDFLLGG
jgi:hypothetical protein